MEQWRNAVTSSWSPTAWVRTPSAKKPANRPPQVIPHSYVKYAGQGPVAALRRAITEANASIHACGQQNREFEGMGTTGTALVLRPEGAWIGHVGDSRVYRIRAGWIEQLSYDHSLVWEYARIKGIDPEKVKDIPSNVIHRCLGPEPNVQVDVEGPYPLCAGDIFLLCSDGLSGQATDAEIGAVASALPPEEACRFLIDLANLRGGPDNSTVIIVRVLDGPEANGVAPASVTMPSWNGAGGSKRPLVPWWVLSLMSGILLAGAATWLEITERRAFGFPVFLSAALAILAGLAGLGLHYRREHAEEVRPEPEEVPVQPHPPPPPVPRRTGAVGKTQPGLASPPAAGGGEALGAGPGRRGPPHGVGPKTVQNR